ncbi:hypothetical protein [Ornithinimicrobium sp. W1665]|uniref:hypothetical protein n=1 Tax=Ornithinimicrobium sp. W1665 TaxID=3416666 RepID=UPI003CF5CBB4
MLPAETQVRLAEADGIMYAALPDVVALLRESADHVERGIVPLMGAPRALRTLADNLARCEHEWKP